MLGEKLLKAGLITQAQLDQALAEQAKSPGVKLGEILVRLRFVTAEQIASVL
jgi:type IV pilus assembly protein PilB